MAIYNITLSDGVTVVSIADGSIDLTSADIPLVGQNSQLYGDDIAKAQLFMLENFANTSAPAINPLVGQIWYDTGNSNLNVYNGVTWDPIAPIAQGTVANSMLRFDGSDTWLEESQLQLTAGGVLSILDAGLANSVTFDHDSTSLNITGTGTTAQIRIDAANLEMREGQRTSWHPVGGGAQSFEINHDGSDAVFQFVAGGDLVIQQPTNVRIDSVIALKEKASAPADVLTWGQIWVRNTDQLLIYTDESGTDFELNAAAGAADHGALTGLADDDHTQYAVKSGAFGAQAIDAAAGWTFNNRPAFNGGTSGATAPFTVDSTFLVTNLNADLLDGLEATAFAVDADVVHLAGSEEIPGIKTFTTTVIMDYMNNGPNTAIVSGFKVEGEDSTTTDNEGEFSVYQSNGTQPMIHMGTFGGQNWTEIRSHLTPLHLYASNNLRFLIDTNTNIFHGGGLLAATFLEPGSIADNTTSLLIHDVANSVARNAGYNETPESIVSSARTVDNDDIGKFLRRSASTSRVVTVNNGSTIPVGGSLMVHNDHTSGTMTITGSGVTLEWVDGSGSAPPTGTRTLAYNSVATLRKKSSTVWQIWGNGIS